jgi:hypothetical protein
MNIEYVLRIYWTLKNVTAYFKHPRENAPFVLTFALHYAMRTFKQTSKG